jgi:uncharacterized GH25 family protein
MIPRRPNSCAIFAGLIFVAALVVSAALGAEQPGTLKGTLLDPQGAAVPNAVIELRWNDVNQGTGARKTPRNKTLQVRTDTAGQFSLQLAPGDWDVFAYLNGFAPTCTVVRIDAGSTTSTSLRFPVLAPMSLT